MEGHSAGMVSLRGRQLSGLQVKRVKAEDSGVTLMPHTVVCASSARAAGMGHNFSPRSTAAEGVLASG